VVKHSHFDKEFQRRRREERVGLERREKQSKKVVKIRFFFYFSNLKENS
jgi:hypothetical protein